MKCQKAIVLISGKLDGELSKEVEEELDRHLDECPICRKEYEDLLKIKEVTANMRFADLPDRYWAGYWNGVYNRLERGIGWILLSIAVIIVAAFGAWEFFDNFLLDKTVPFMLRFGVGAGILGLVILLISAARERLFAYRHERYKEVER
jgi:predicted anti-sigma-YlaC factor YlaD